MIIDVSTNKSIEYGFREVDRDEVKLYKYLPDFGWAFNWLHPLSHDFKVFALVAKQSPSRVEGLIALKENSSPDFMCIDVDIIESSPVNKKEVHGERNYKRKYKGVGRALVAFACWYSIDKGYDGYVGLTSKSSKVDLYEGMGGKLIYGNSFMFDEEASHRLIHKYFPGGVVWCHK